MKIVVRRLNLCCSSSKSCPASRPSGPIDGAGTDDRHSEKLIGGGSLNYPVTQMPLDRCDRYPTTRFNESGAAVRPPSSPDFMSKMQ